MRPPRRPPRPAPLTSEQPEGNKAGAQVPESTSAATLARVTRPALRVRRAAKTAQIERAPHATSAQDALSAAEDSDAAVIIEDGDTAYQPIEHAEPELAAPIRMSARRKERRAEHRRIRVKQALSAGGIGFAVLLALWLALYSPLFALDLNDVKVRGASSSVSEESVVAALQPFEGTSLVRLNEAKAEAAVEKLSMVRRATVARAWPTGATVTIALRTPIACVEQNDSCVAIDEDGVKLSIPTDEADALPHMVLSDSQSDAGKASTAMLEVLAALDSSVRQNVTSIAVDKNLQLTLNMSNGAQVFWGQSSENDFKAQVLGVLLAQNAGWYDVSSPRAPVTQ